MRLSKYRLEHLDSDGHWYIVADRLTEHDAHYYRAHYRRLYPNIEFRVVEDTIQATEVKSCGQ